MQQGSPKEDDIAIDIAVTEYTPNSIPTVASVHEKLANVISATNMSYKSSMIPSCPVGRGIFFPFNQTLLQ
jgi:hypothetical protein